LERVQKYKPQKILTKRKMISKYIVDEAQFKADQN
jgi:hypothetical protein